MPMEGLLSKIDEGRAHVCVIGLGYVGLPLAVAFAEAGFRVTGLEVSDAKVMALSRGESYIPDIPDARLGAQVEAGRLRATTDPGVLQEADTVHICVPTPLGKTRDPDVSFVNAAATEVSLHFHPGMLIVLESTTYPGTTEEIMLPLFDGDARVGEDFFLCFSPERIDPGNREYTLRNTPKIIGGMTPPCGRVAERLYGTICDHVHLVSSPRAAELVKLLENTFRAVNIALVNEMAMMCDRLDIDTWEVIEAASTKPFGFMPFYPGPGLGGHCIPVDPHYLTWKVRTLDYQARLIEVASEINAGMPEYVFGKVVDALNDRARAVNGSRVLVLGVAYKPNVDDTRESPALDIIRLLQRKGADVDFADPHVAELGAEEGFDPPIRPIDGVPGVCADYDCVVVGTDHAAFDWPAILDAAPLVIDTRNVARGRADDHIVRL
ncbi:MAG: nucleotide sugar dehydrogenase [Acidobacteriota bacterium]